jgi:hypothetical protein
LPMMQNERSWGNFTLICHCFLLVQVSFTIYKWWLFAAFLAVMFIRKSKSNRWYSYAAVLNIIKNL